MTNKNSEYFEKLIADREKNGKALSSFALRGTKNSVVEKYSDQAHFIYELIQNADDARATCAEFELHQDKLIFKHNGKRPFSISNPETEEDDQANGLLGDINSITAIGSSTKSEKSVIGKFGVGFKAVFQYTDTPHIYTDNFKFSIENLIVPRQLNDDFEGRNQNETLFVFPFNAKKISSEIAFEEIKGKLNALSYPVLFINNLSELIFTIDENVGLYSKKIMSEVRYGDTTAQLIKFSKTINDFDEIERIWIFTRTDNENRAYSVGFFINEDGKLKPVKHPAFCFFPTKETTELNFIIHAPFLLTDSRESIKAGDSHNKEMIKLLSILAADSITYLKEIGLGTNTRLIDDDIFEIVPYNERKFAEISDINRISFKPFYNSIKSAFQNNSLLPTIDGYAPKINAFWASVPTLTRVFSNAQLADIYDRETASWVFLSFGRDEKSRNDIQLSDYITSIIDRVIDEAALIRGASKSFIERQNFEWLNEFYKWVGETQGRKNIFKKNAIFLNQDGIAKAAFDSKGQLTMFLPRESSVGYDFIHKSLVENEETRKLLDDLKITEPSLKDEIYNKILPFYEGNDEIDTLPHMKKFFEYYQICPNNEINDFVNLIKDLDIILFCSAEDETQYRGKASEIYLQSEDLKRWFATKPNTKFLCLNNYIEYLGMDNKQKFVEFLQKLGVANEPRILPKELSYEEALKIRPNWERSTYDRKWSYNSIDGMFEILEKVSNENDIELSKMLWDQLGRFSNRLNLLQDGQYRYFYYSWRHERFDAPDLIMLRSKPWVVDTNNNFVAPENIKREKLNECYDTISHEGKKVCDFLTVKNNYDEISFAEFLRKSDLSEAEHMQAIEEYKNKKNKQNLQLNSLQERALSEISEKIAAAGQSNSSKNHIATDAKIENDEDEFTKASISIEDKIEKIKDKAAAEIDAISKLEELKAKAENAEKYSYLWFKTLLELEELENNKSDSNSREISISFASVARETDTARTLILKHPSRYIPQFMEELTDIPLEFNFRGGQSKKIAIEVMSVASYTLRVKLRAGVDIDEIDFSKIVEAKIQAHSPAFLLEKLSSAIARLDFEDNFNLSDNLCENIEFVFGPPGTGKTTHLARNIIIPLMKSAEDLKILVLTPTNKSADVLVSKIMSIFATNHSYKDWLVRFGNTGDEEIEQSGVFRDKSFDIRKYPKNVTVTTIARFSYDFFMPDANTRLHLSELKWDYIIIDEASMINLANIIYPLFKKTPIKFIIAGDPFQIEPITQIELWKDENIYTLVGLDSFTEPDTYPHSYKVELLNTQYRSIPEIGRIYSEFAYGGVLKHNRASASIRKICAFDSLGLKPLSIFKFPVSKYESVYRPKRLQGKSNYHIYSALFAYEMVQHLVKIISEEVGNEDFRIGLIAPYRAQSDLIDKLLSAIEFPNNIDVQVGTIHGFQGDECDIIFALFNPPPNISNSTSMFLNKINIINVAISRARDYLFIIMPDDGTENVENLFLIKRVENLCKSQPAFAELSTKLVEETIFNQNNYIEENSFSTSHQQVNVYGKPEKKYEIRSEDDAIDIQVIRY